MLNHLDLDNLIVKKASNNSANMINLYRFIFLVKLLQMKNVKKGFST